jgi:hypothetical protein
VTRLAPFLIALILYGGALVVIAPSPQGDEPHYALEAISLVRDHDRDLADEYADPALLRSVFGSTALTPHAYRHPGSDAWTSIHAVGLPLLLAPAAAFSTSLQWMRVEMVLLAALAALLLMRLLERLPFGSPGVRWAAWAAVVASAPMVVYATAVFAEVPAVVLVLAATLLLTRRRPGPGPGALAAAAGAAALLPWLNQRFVVLTAVLALGALWVALRSRRPRAAALAVLVPLAVSAIALALASRHWYGSLSPGAAYAFKEQTRTLSGAYRFGLGGLLSPTYGLLAQVPVALLAVVALGLAVRRLGPAAALGVLGAALYVLVIAFSGIGFPGASFAGRLQLVLLPLAAVPLVVLLALQPRWRWPFGMLLALSLALTARVVLEPAASAATGAPGTAMARYERLWPSFAAPEAPVDRTSPPADVAAELGRPTRRGPLPAGAAEAVVAPAGRPGTVERLTTDALPVREYTAAVVLRADAPSADTAATVTVSDAAGDPLFAWTLTGAQIPPADGYRPILVPFALHRPQPITVAVHTTGAVGLRAGPVQVASSPGASQAAVRGYPGLAGTLAWIAILLGAGVAVVVYDAKRGRTSRA